MLRSRLALAFAVLAVGLPAQQPAPDVLRAQVPNRGLANGEPFALGDEACQCTRIDGRPFLIWSRADRLSAPNDPVDAATWLRRHAADLGHGVFTPVFARATTWDRWPVLIFTLEHGGVALHDAEIWVCFDATGCLGLRNRVPVGLATPPAVPQDAIDVCYRARRDANAPDRLVVAERRRSTTATHDIVEFVESVTGGGGTVFARELTQRTTAAPDNPAQFTVYSFGGFPDQIQADARGVIWCSDPTLNRLLEIDPQTGTAIPRPTTPYTQPDGLCVAPDDKVWTGLYTGGNGLGVFDRRTSQFTRYPPPPGGSQLAIPTWHHDGRIYVTEHPSSRLHIFVTASATWLPSIQFPANSWPVGAAYDGTSGDVFVPLWSANRMARVSSSTIASSLPTPVAAGPSFCAPSNGKVWFSYWSTTQLGELDVATGTFTTYNFPQFGAGGPIDVGQNGHVYLGTRQTGFIIDFDPVTGTAIAHPIPSSAWQLKDGLTVAPDGTVWFTSSNNGLVVRMTLP